MKRFYLGIILSILLALSIKAWATDSQFIVSYVEHEGIIQYYVPLLNTAYRDIGIEPHFELINDKRALKLLDQGLIDADSAKSLEFVDSYPNILVVPTPISQIDVVLLCKQNLLCDLSALKQSNRSLGLIAANEFYAQLLEKSVVSIVELTSFDKLMRVFEQGKVDYAIVVFDDYTNNIRKKYKNQYLIQQKIGYHLLNKKHHAILHELDRAIQKAKKQGRFIKPDL